VSMGGAFPESLRAGDPLPKVKNPHPTKKSFPFKDLTLEVLGVG